MIKWKIYKERGEWKGVETKWERVEKIWCKENKFLKSHKSELEYFNENHIMKSRRRKKGKWKIIIIIMNGHRDKIEKAHQKRI